MVESVCFLLGKHPEERQGGDVAVSRLVMRLAAESYSVSALAYVEIAGNVGKRGTFTGIQKPPLRPGHVAWNVLRSRRSTIHCRFDTDGFRRAVERTDADKLVAEHTYMAEPVLRTLGGPDRLWINTHVSEADVLKGSGGIRKLEAEAVLRDELRVAKAAQSVGCFDDDEANRFREAGITWLTSLDVTFEPAARSIDVVNSPRNMLFIGDQTWGPNFDAVRRLYRIWPLVRTRVPDARLKIVGRPDPRLRSQAPEGVDVLGFVDDLEGVMHACRALVAPIRTGGGVRVKILEVSARGLPVVGTEAAVGTLGRVLNLTPYRSEDQIVESCVALLMDRHRAAREGADLYERNRANWESGVPQDSVSKWLGFRRSV